MIQVIRKIDEALKTLYELDLPYRAEDFLMYHRVEGSLVGNAALQGALYLHGDAQDVAIGIFLSEEVRKNLSSLSNRSVDEWSAKQLQAFAVATEEISHFNYFIYHAPNGRQLSQLELELQGEIDKFLLCWFAAGKADFDQMFESLFYRFSLAEGLTDEQKERYLEANRLARKFIHRHGRSLLLDPRKREKAFQWLRRFYRLNAAEKLSVIGA